MPATTHYADVLCWTRPLHYVRFNFVACSGHVKVTVMAIIKISSLRSYASTVLGVLILPVRLSICHACFVT